MKALWKQEKDLDPTFLPVHVSLRDDWFLLAHEIRLQSAHAETLTLAGVLSRAECEALERALVEISAEFGESPPPESDAEDIHTWMETELTRRTGDAGRKIHTARSRNDQVATLILLHLRQETTRLRQDLVELVTALCRQAMASANLELPLQTHAQFAAPGSAGAWGLRHAVAFQRDVRHIDWLASEWRRFCPLGSGAVGGSSIPIDRDLQARLLGFDGPSPSALDSTSSRDESLQALAFASQAAVHLQSLATDGITFSQTPFGWLRPAKGLSTGSSMMPNKTNPDALELLRGESCRVQGAQMQALLLLKGLPSGYNRDLQALKPVVRDALQALHGLFRLAAAFVRDAEFDPERLRAALALGDVEATLRMEQRVLSGETLREAHHAEAGGTPRPREVTDDASATRLGAGLYRTSGSAAPEEVRWIAARILDELSSD